MRLRRETEADEGRARDRAFMIVWDPQLARLRQQATDTPATGIIDNRHCVECMETDLIVVFP